MSELFLYVSNEQFMKSFDLIKKNDPKDLIQIFRRLVASNEESTRSRPILIYGGLFGS